MDWVWREEVVVDEVAGGSAGLRGTGDQRRRGGWGRS